LYLARIDFPLPGHCHLPLFWSLFGLVLGMVLVMVYCNATKTKTSEVFKTSEVWRGVGQCGRGGVDG